MVSDGGVDLSGFCKILGCEEAAVVLVEVLVGGVRSFVEQIGSLKVLVAG